MSTKRTGVGVHQTFEQWSVSVDFWINRELGLSKDDLPDCPYREWYEDRVSPRTAAKRAIKMVNE